MKKITTHHIVRVASPIAVDVDDLLKPTKAYDGKVSGTLVYDGEQRTCVLIVTGATIDALCEAGVDWYDIAPCPPALAEELRRYAKSLQRYRKENGFVPDSAESTVRYVDACLSDKRCY